MINTIIVLLLLFLAVCGKVIHYAPGNTVNNASQAKEIIRQIVQEQPGELAPIKVEVTDKYIKMYKIKSNQLDGYNIPWNQLIYFNSIGKVEIREKKRQSKKWFVVSLMDKKKNLICTIYTAMENKAKTFIDALHTMRTTIVSQNNM